MADKIFILAVPGCKISNQFLRKSKDIINLFWDRGQFRTDLLDLEEDIFIPGLIY